MTSFQEKTVNSKTQNIFWLLNQLPLKQAIFRQNRLSGWKDIALFPKAFSQNKQTLPLHSSGTGGPFRKPKPFLKYYTKTLLKMPKISQIWDTFFSKWSIKHGLHHRVIANISSKAKYISLYSSCISVLMPFKSILALETFLEFLKVFC